jgi:hypothetical protein
LLDQNLAECLRNSGDIDEYGRRFPVSEQSQLWPTCTALANSLGLAEKSFS